MPKSEIVVPDSFDSEWQSKMLRRLSSLLNSLYDESTEAGNTAVIEESKEIVDALRMYSGF